MLIRKRTSIFDEICFNYEQLFHHVQCTAPKKNVYVTQQLNWFCQGGLVFCQLQVNFVIFVEEIVSVTVHDNIQLV